MIAVDLPSLAILDKYVGYMDNGLMRQVLTRNPLGVVDPIPDSNAPETTQVITLGDNPGTDVVYSCCTSAYGQ